MGNQRRASARSILPPFIACSGRQGITVKGPRTYNEIPVFVALFRARRHGWPPHMRVSAIGTDRPSSELGRYFMDQKPHSGPARSHQTNEISRPQAIHYAGTSSRRDLEAVGWR